MWQKKSNVVNELGKSASIWRAWEGEDGTIGKTYGYQLGKKAKYSYGELDQVDNLIYLLKNKPMDRRMITTMWCPEDLNEMNLPPCVYETLWDVSDGKLNCTVIQRSGDLLAAAASGGWDTIQYALLVHMLAQVCGYQPGTLVHIVNNLHIYDRHMDLVKEVIVREKGTVIQAEIFPDYEYAKKKFIRDIPAKLQEVIDAYNADAPVYKRVLDLVVRETEFEKNTSKKIKRHS
jgi:thymidylate synthase